MTRKYGQRGYQEGERERGERPPSPAGAPLRAPPDRPRGRGLGAPSQEVFRCAVCGTEQAAPATLEAACGKCLAELHSCTQCRHFDSGARWECRQPITERVAKKSQRNACALFVAKVSVEHARDKPDPSDPRAAFDALFKL